jgi:hypothetical protein
MRDVSSDEESPTHIQLETQQQDSCNYATERDTYHEIEVFHEHDAKETDNVASLSNAAVTPERQPLTAQSNNIRAAGGEDDGTREDGSTSRKEEDSNREVDKR